MKILDCIHLVDRIILQGYLDGTLRGIALLKLVVEDIALLEKDFCDLLFIFEDGTSTTRCPAWMAFLNLVK